MKKFIFPAFILVLLMFSACKKSNDISGINVDVSMDISYVDQNGNDLLRPSTPNAYDVSRFCLEYYHQGKLETYYKSNYDAKYGVTQVFHIPSSQYLAVRIFPPADTTYLKLSNGDVDTILNPRAGGRTSPRITKVWYNGKLVWDEINKTSRYIVIKKQVN